ncbi:MAG: tRNA (N(6)-L-threonylcarbamoyladenosine(37)-C(2))-methylthiotransferase MtaB [Gemmatimonadota bacterium]|nr:MAG: tRNA (N(6)-L-threonylcarbamoyladenosine(37)-C(2))-methylthiotransferase MtaB [Gemmatimonadota bacterium]
MPTAAFHTLGCKLNQYETEALREQFETQGYTVVPFSSVADVYVVNTCTVTAKSDRSSRKAIYQALRRAPGARIVATGCSAELFPQSFADIPGVDLVVSNKRKGKVYETLTQTLSQDVVLSHDSKPESIDENGWFDISRFRNYSRAFLKIQDGCNARCSYCVVPFARGGSRSRPLQSILSQSHQLIDSGYKEIVLTGVHLGAYGADFSEEISLADVLEALIDIEQLWRVRLSSIEPMECSPRLVDVIASSSKICRHVHIPLQSGDDRILKRMNRNYTTKDYLDVIETLVAHIPDIGIGSDVMVGFPGETDSHFHQSFQFVKELPLSYFHVFSYSRRPKTSAAQYREHVPDEVKKDRSAIFRQLRSEKMDQFRRRFIGDCLDVLFEYRRDQQTGMLTGLSDNYIRVKADGPDCLQGEPVTVHIHDVAGEQTYGSVVKVN